MRKKKRKIILDIVIAVSSAVLLLALLYLGSLYINYNKSNQEYETLKENAIEEGQEEESEECFEIDWEYLHSINPDVVAWIRFPNMDISHPIVQGDSNNEYLHTTVEGTYAYAGSIFMDSACSLAFTDDNTVIYGHNMRNLSMFGRLKLLYRDPDLLQENEYFWIYTEDYTYKYDIFALGYAQIANENFHFVNGTAAMKQDYIDFCMENTMYEMPVEASVNDSIVTLSTCTTTSSDTERFQVHAIRTDTLPNG